MVCASMMVANNAEKQRISELYELFLQQLLPRYIYVIYHIDVSLQSLLPIKFGSILKISSDGRSDNVHIIYLVYMHVHVANKCCYQMNFTLLNNALKQSFSKFSDHIYSYAVKLVETTARQMLQQHFFRSGGTRLYICTPLFIHALPNLTPPKFMGRVEEGSPHQF